MLPPARRRLLLALAATAALALAGCAPKGDDGPQAEGEARATGTAGAELHLYNWNNYLAEETAKKFEEACKCRLVQDYYSDNEEMLAKLAAGATGYDLIVPTGNAVQTLIAQGALREIDHARLPNLANIKPEFLNQFFDPGNRYSVPYAYSVTLLGYNAEKMKELGLPTDTWAVLFEPELSREAPGQGDGARLPARALRRGAQVPRPLGERDRRGEAQGGARPDPAREAVLGGVQRLVVHQGTDHRQHLARARLLERHVPGGAGRGQGEAPVHDRAIRRRRKARCWRSTAW